MTTVHEVLTSAEIKLSRPRGWAKGALAYCTDDWGQVVRCSPLYDGAESFCAQGSVEASIPVDLKPGEREDLYEGALDAIWAAVVRLKESRGIRVLSAKGVRNVAGWNDHPETTLDDVQAVFKIARKAALAKAREASPKAELDRLFNELSHATGEVK